MSIGVICDGCDEPAERNLLSSATAWVGNTGYHPAVADPRLLERANWTEANGKHFCPSCTSAIVYEHVIHRRRVVA